jgi:hypothetical protein
MSWVSSVFYRLRRGGDGGLAGPLRYRTCVAKLSSHSGFNAIDCNNNFHVPLRRCVEP